MTLMLSQPSIDVDSPVVASASFDPPIVRPGETTTYRVTMNALEASITWPKQLATSPQIDLRPGGHGQMLQIVGSAFQPRTSFNYHFRPNAAGNFTVPEFSVMVYGKPVKVPAAQLEVAADLPAAPPQGQRLLLEIPSREVFVGQPLRVSVVLPGSAGSVQALAQVQLSGDGFIVDQTAVRQRIETGTRPGIPANVPLFIYETILTPITSGKLSVFAQGFTAGNRFGGSIIISGGVTIPGGPPQYTLLDSDPVELQVRPLPPEGQLPGFNGAVGNFAVATPSLSTNLVAVGDALKLSVKIYGDANSTLARLVPPAPAKVKDWQIFLSPSDTSPPQPVSPQAISGLESAPAGFAPASFITVQYTLIPLSDNAETTPAIPFSYFSPERGAYADLTIPAVPVTVRPGAAPADLAALAQADKTAPEVEKPPVLGGLAVSPGLAVGSLVPWQRRPWFPLVQLAPGVVFLGLWQWARRRRFLEQHPEIVMRRRARRALRREWRALQQAARAQDGPRFATAAVSAMRVACAPHFPADARALVGADVLAVIPEAERTSKVGEAVRRCFDVTDATRFAPSSADAAQLLPLQPQVEQVLAELEAKL
jgi:hypothetical protein